MPNQRLPLYPLLRRLLLVACASLSLIAQAESAADAAFPERAPIETSTAVAVSPEFPRPLGDTGSVTALQANPGFGSLTPGAETPEEIHDELSKIATIDLTTPPDDLWQRMRNGFSMPNLDSPLVAERQAWYLNRPEMLRHVLDRSRRYLFYIVGELEKRGMPTELALLPIIESSYNPMAYSHARASGIWQFIPSTGKNYRLEQNWWIDQRRDIIASTGAALDYLQAIYEMQGDWHLALASYNWGEFAVGRAIAKNQARHLPADYAHINMPSETRYYVPKLQALKNIIANPKLFGINIDPIPNKPYFDTVDKPADMDVSLAAKLAETPLDEFLALNPSYNRPVIPAGKGSSLVLPAGKVQTFLTNLRSHEDQDKPLSNWQTYTLKHGERLDKVAARFHLTTARLRQINGISGKMRVVAGNTLLVPGRNAPAGVMMAALNVPQEPAASPPRTRHAGAARTVKHGRKAAALHGKQVKPVKVVKQSKHKAASHPRLANHGHSIHSAHSAHSTHSAVKHGAPVRKKH